MARYKPIDRSPRLLPVDLVSQLLPGTFEHALDHLIDHELDLSTFDDLYRNDDRGATAYPPGMLLKIVLFAYSRGIVSSRDIERACHENVTFMALSGDRRPHFTTIAGFVSSRSEPIAAIFSQVLYICDQEGLIGRDMFAIDGVKLPSNASKRRSGTRADFQRQARKLEVAAKTMIARHRDRDEGPLEPDLAAKESARVERLRKQAASIRKWLRENPEDRKGGRTGKVLKSNRTDNESAKMASSKGVLQGYCAVAVVDAKAQIVVEAQAHGTASEQELLVPMVKTVQPMLKRDSLVVADSGYHSEANLAALAELKVEALVADHDMRKRDERFATQSDHHEAPHPVLDRTARRKGLGLFVAADFAFDRKGMTCVCPAGKRLYRAGSNIVSRGGRMVQFRGAKSVCGPCPLREQCLRTPDRTPVRQVSFYVDKGRGFPHTSRMKDRIDSSEGRALYAQRIGIVEPVFGNLRYNKGLDRFTLRGRTKVDGQWKLFVLVHNIEKLSNHRFDKAA